ERPLHAGPPLLQPGMVAADLPVPVCFDDPAQLAVDAGVKIVGRRSEWQSQAEGHAAVLAQVVFVVGLAHRAFEAGKEKRQGLLVVPDVGAGPLATAAGWRAPFPPVERAVAEPKTGG